MVMWRVEKRKWQCIEGYHYHNICTTVTMSTSSPTPYSERRSLSRYQNVLMILLCESLFIVGTSRAFLLALWSESFSVFYKRLWAYNSLRQYFKISCRFWIPPITPFRPSMLHIMNWINFQHKIGFDRRWLHYIIFLGLSHHIHGFMVFKCADYAFPFPINCLCNSKTKSLTHHPGISLNI